jgi:uncharacterized secreted protein with C-terminal beta-propeller domain
VDITAVDGEMHLRDTLAISGAPQGRFHMDYWNGMFRIVTYDRDLNASVLHVLDVRNPGELTVMGALHGIGRDEELYATLFMEDRAYVVTFFAMDPLWVIDLSDPTTPALVGELWVPGWSDFLFPRPDNQLLAVGRGAAGDAVGVSLFDVSDPTMPLAVDQIELGREMAFSEGNIDFRGVTVIEPGALGDAAMLSLPVSSYLMEGGCEHTLALIDVHASHLDVRSESPQQNSIRRSLPIGERLYAISENDVLAMDVSDRSSPSVVGSVSIGNPVDPWCSLVSESEPSSDGGSGSTPPASMEDSSTGPSVLVVSSCQLAPTGRGASSFWVLALGAGVALVVRRRRRR